MDGQARESIQRIEEKIHRRTSASNTDIDKKMRMEVNASDYATRGVLSMECKNGL